MSASVKLSIKREIMPPIKYQMSYCKLQFSFYTGTYFRVTYKIAIRKLFKCETFARLKQNFVQMIRLQNLKTTSKK